MISFLILYLIIFIKSNNINKAIPNNNFRKDRVKRKVQIETYFDTSIEIETNYITIYNLTVAIYYFYNMGLNLNIISTPELMEDITLLITLYIDKYNDSLGYWTSKEIDVRAYDYYGTREMFSAYIDDLNLDNLTSYISITILNISVESNNIIYKYYVYFDEMTFYFPEESDTYTSWSMTDSYYEYYTDSDTYSSQNTSNNSNSLVINRGTNTSGISKGAIIGIIIGIVAAIGVAITIFCIFCRGKKEDKKINDSLNGLKSKNSEGNTIDPIKTIKFKFETIKQAKIEMEIDENKHIQDIRILYFEKIGQPELIGDKSIYFLAYGEILPSEPNVAIKDIFKDNEKPHVIVVQDEDDKIKLK